MFGAEYGVGSGVRRVRFENLFSNRLRLVELSAGNEDGCQLQLGFRVSLVEDYRLAELPVGLFDVAGSEVGASEPIVRFRQRRLDRGRVPEGDQRVLIITRLKAGLPGVHVFGALGFRVGRTGQEKRSSQDYEKEPAAIH
jgi:hypothetical protein